jgi:pimeloyl-ACP methyl ester carboxylesterase
VIGHSLGGLLARVVAVRMPEFVNSVTTLASPFRGVAAHPAVLCAALGVRWVILKRRGRSVTPYCFSDACACDFVRTLDRGLPRSVYQTAIYTKLDGLVDW